MIKRFIVDSAETLLDFLSCTWPALLVITLLIGGCSYLSDMELRYTGNPTPEVVNTCSTASRPEECMRINGYRKVWAKP